MVRKKIWFIKFLVTYLYQVGHTCQLSIFGTNQLYPDTDWQVYHYKNCTDKTKLVQLFAVVIKFNFCKLIGYHLFIY